MPQQPQKPSRPRRDDGELRQCRRVVRRRIQDRERWQRVGRVVSQGDHEAVPPVFALRRWRGVLAVPLLVPGHVPR